MSHQNHHDDDEDFGNNTGYKPGEKKSLAEYSKLDAGDESLARWKASLGVASAGGTSPLPSSSWFSPLENHLMGNEEKEDCDRK